MNPFAHAALVLVMTAVVIGFTFLVLSRAMPPLNRWVDRVNPPRKSHVTFDDAKIIYSSSRGDRSEVLWDELVEVGILTTSAGPAVDDVFWALLDGKRGCMVPSEAVGMTELIARLQRLPGFDNMALVKAMGSTADAAFRCWRKVPNPSIEQTVVGKPPTAPHVKR